MAYAGQEETINRHYFSLNYDYNTILSFLERNHGIKISKRTLLNCLNMVAHRCNMKKNIYKYKSSLVKHEVVVQKYVSLYKNLSH
jgi:hypothetical protein